MVSRLLKLLFFASAAHLYPWGVYPWDEGNIDKPAIKAKLEELANDFSPEEQKDLIRNAFKDENGKPKEAKFSKEALDAFYELSSSDVQKQFMEDRLIKDYTPLERQNLITSFLEEFSYSDLMINNSPEECKLIGEAGNPTYFGVMPIIDWINIAHFKGLFNPPLPNVLVNRDTHNEFDSFNQLGFWIEPFGFYTTFHRDSDLLQFNEYTVGINAGINWTFFDRLVLGLGLAYSHSGIDWHKSSMSAGINSLYFGPSINYVFSYGYVGMSLFGVANFNHIDRETNLFPKFILETEKTHADFTSYDLMGRIESGFSFTPGGRFYINPQVRLDYLTVFEPGFTEQLDKEIELNAESFQNSFLTTKMGLDFSQEFYQPAIGFLIPTLSFGWISFTPLALNPYTFQIGKEESDKSELKTHSCGSHKKKLEINPWSQYYFGVGFTIVHEKAILVGFNYELTAGVNSPVQAGSIRVELSW